MDIQTQDGIVLRGIPDGTPDEAIKARIAQIRGSAPTPETQPKPELDTLNEVQNALARNFTFGLSDKAAAAGRATAASLAGDNFSDTYHQRLKELRDNGEQFKKDHPALYQLGATPGFVASMGTMGGKAPETLLGRVGQGAQQGAEVGGLTSYGNNNDESLAETGKDVVKGGTIGAAIGGAVPIAADAVKGLYGVAKKFIEPLTESGRANILTRYQDELLGGNSNARQQVIAALNGAKEIVPGSKPTAGEAIADIPEATGLAAHQKVMSKTPGVSGEFAAREAEQQGARNAAISDIAQTPADLAAAKGQRLAEGTQNYEKAFNNVIKSDPELAKLAENPYYKDALPDALKLAEAKGLDPKTDITEVQHFVKLSLDKMLRRTGDTALASTEKGAVNSLQKDLVGWIEKNNPDYAAARSAFSTASKPINEMEVGRYLKDKLVAPLENTERAAGFAQAVRDAPGTIQRSTGGPRFTELGQVLSPGKEQVVTSILEDLQRKAGFDRLARGTNISGGRSVIGGADGLHLPNLLSRPAMLANFVMKNIGQGADAKINSLAADRYLNPQMLADAFKNMPTGKRSEIVAALLQKLSPAGASLAVNQTQGIR